MVGKHFWGGSGRTSGRATPAEYKLVALNLYWCYNRLLQIGVGAFIMKYQSHIESSYAKFGYTPRGSQIATINNVLTEFLDNECSTVVLNADTGT